MLKYIKKSFEKPENGLMQVIITHVLVFIGLVFIQLIHKLTGFVNFDTIRHYIHLSTDGTYAKPWTFLTYFFVHQHLGGLLANLLWLYTFGRVVVYLLGSKKFLMLYVLGGIVGGIIFVLSYTFLPYLVRAKEVALQSGKQISLIGGSSALYAVIAGIVSFAPNFSLSFLPFFSVKIKHVALIFFIWPVLCLAYSEGEEGVNIARLGGGLWGYLYMQYLLLYHNKKWHAWLNQLYINLKNYQHTKKSADSSTSPKKYDGKLSEKEIEAILDKIALYGYKKLTEEEKRKLFHAGEE